MATSPTATTADIQDRVAELKSQIAVVQEELQSMLRGAGGLWVVLLKAHNKVNGRIDARKVARQMGVPLKRLAEGLGLNSKATHRNPSAESLQGALKPVKRSLEILHECFGKPETARVWLNTPHPDLDGRTSLELILAGNLVAVSRILENALAGVPV